MPTHLPTRLVQNCIEQSKPLLTCKHKAYIKWLAFGKQEDLTRFISREARGTAERAVRRAKNIWFQGKAKQIHKEKLG